MSSRPKKDYVKDISKKVKERLESRAHQVALQLSPALQSGDATNESRRVYYDIIRQNWHDPKFRMKQANARGAARFVQDALQAHGLKPGLLGKNADVVLYGFPEWKEDATEEFMKWLAAYTQEHEEPPKSISNSKLPEFAKAGIGPLGKIPHFAQGGIVDQPTVALIGENGPEAVVPLTPEQKEKKQEQDFMNGQDVTV